MADEPHDRITHVDLLNFFDSKIERSINEMRTEMRELRNEMRWLIGISLALMMLFMAFVTLLSGKSPS